MKKFINIETGNVVRVKNAATVALMEKSNAYKEAPVKKAKTAKANKDGNNTADTADTDGKPE